MLSEKLAAQWIGGVARLFSLTINNKKISGYMGGAEMTIVEAKRRVLATQNVAEAKGVVVFCGSSSRARALLNSSLIEGVAIFVVPRLTQPDIADLCDVNIPVDYNSPEVCMAFIKNHPDSNVAKRIKSGRATIEDLSGPPPEKRRQQIRKLLGNIELRHPFRIIYAERKGLEARFLKQLSKAEAAEVEKEIANVNIEAFDFTDPLSIKDYILKNQAFALWWD